MSGNILPHAFYSRDTEVVAREMLGALLVSRSDAGIAVGRIVETEAYLGEHDAACHAAAGVTRRTRGLYGPPGTSYVYFIYGRYWCMNAVTRAEGLPSAVLVRALEPVSGVQLMQARRGAAVPRNDITNGPGKLCIALGIDNRHNGVSLRSGSLIIRSGEPVRDEDVCVSPRIGISRAADWPLRFFVRGSEWVSRTPGRFAVESLVTGDG